jgi:hypothetical protein
MMLKVLISLTNGVLKLRGCALGIFCDPQVSRTSEDVLVALRMALTMPKVCRLRPRASAYAPLLVYAPLLAHVAPTLLIGYGLVIPNSPIAGLNEYTIGFAFTVAGFVPAYLAGVRIARLQGARHHA